MEGKGEWGKSYIYKTEERERRLTESYGVVGYHICFTRKGPWVRTPVTLLFMISPK